MIRFNPTRKGAFSAAAVVMLLSLFSSYSCANESDDTVTATVTAIDDKVQTIIETVTAESTSLEDNATCAYYCDMVLGEGRDPGACSVDNQENYNERIAIYDNRDQCMETCKTFPDDAKDGAESGDSVQCRTTHAILAKGEEGPEKHCPHASPGGGGVCINRSPCLAYCVFYFDRINEGECSAIAQWGGTSHNGKIVRKDFTFEPSPACMNACANFAGAGQAWEMSGDSANCRQEFYLMAHRRNGTSESDGIQRKDLCSNAHPYTSKMCQGSTFGDYFTTTALDACKELCYNDQLTCNSQYGSTDECMATCAEYPTGERQATEGNSAQCRLTWAQYAFFQTDPTTQAEFCALASASSPACTDSGEMTTELQQTINKGMQAVEELHSH